MTTYCRGKIFYLVMCAVAIWFVFGAGTALAATRSNYGWIYNWFTLNDFTCGTNLNYSVDTSEYGTDTPISSSFKFDIYNTSYSTLLASYPAVNAPEAGPGCYNKCTNAYMVDGTGGTTYPDFGGAYSLTDHCGNPADKSLRVKTQVYLNPTSSGMDYQAISPANQWINSVPNFKIQLINFPETITQGATTYTATTTATTNKIFEVFDRWESASSVSMGLRSFSGGKDTYTYTLTAGQIAAMKDGQHWWSFYSQVKMSSTFNMISSRTPLVFYGLDRVAPVINSYDYAPVAPGAGDDVTITATSTDPMSGLASIKIYVDGVLSHTCTKANQTSPQSCTFDAGTFAAGSTHTYAATALDQAGNTTPLPIAKNFTIAAPITVTADFGITPLSGGAPLNVTVSASNIGGTATGTISYYYWDNCSSACVTKSDCESACGTATSSVDASKTISYASAGEYHPRIVIERQGAYAADGATVTAGFDIAPLSGAAVLDVVISAPDIGGTATGTISYYYWDNCSSTCVIKSDCESACGTATSSVDASKTISYASAGEYHPRIVMEQGGEYAADGATVTVGVNLKPEVTNESANIDFDYCVDPASSIFSWNYSDPEHTSQSAYRIQAINEGEADFSSPSIDSGKIPASNNSWGTVLPYGHSYRWRAMVWDSDHLASDWVEGDSFQTPLHKYPKADFNFLPTNPIIGEDVQFTDNSISYDSDGLINSWEWTFEDGTPGTSSEENPSVMFPKKNNLKIELKVTDADDFTCSVIKTLSVRRRLPQWKEVYSN